jgi:GH25 family lysozyme M1 (1,4-beta-N-acetylmuramidase)
VAVVRAVDVSAWTGEITPAAWAAMRSSGIDLAIIQGHGGGPRGTGVNPFAEQQAAAAREAGLLVAGYAWPPSSWAEALAVLRRSIASLLFLALDVESGARVEQSHVVGCFNAGVHPVIYTSRSQWAAIMGGSTDFKDVDLWDAVYPLSRGPGDWPTDLTPGFVPYGGWSRRIGWQWRGTTPLFGESVDLNVFDLHWVEARMREAGLPGDDNEPGGPDMPLSDDDVKRITDAVAERVRNDRERDTSRVYVAHAGYVYVLTEDQRLVHVVNPTVLTAQDPAWDIQPVGADSPILNLPTVYPAGVPAPLRQP